MGFDIPISSQLYPCSSTLDKHLGDFSADNNTQAENVTKEHKLSGKA
jgi:hypothetical protein